MKPGQKVKFVENGKTYDGVVLGPMCQTGVYIQPEGTSNDFPRLIMDKDSIVLIDDEPEVA